MQKTRAPRKRKPTNKQEIRAIQNSQLARSNPKAGRLQRKKQRGQIQGFVSHTTGFPAKGTPKTNKVASIGYES